jgi:hypothetical protein
MTTTPCRHRLAACSPASADGGTTSLAPYIYPPREPLGLFVPRLTPSRRHRYADVEKILAGEPHGPVVYFARVGRNVKIGTTSNLRSRIRHLYLSLDDVLAVVPGGKAVEDLYHQRFSDTKAEDRPELFRPGLRLRLYLARCQCSWAEAAAALGVASAVAISFRPYALGAVLGVLVLSAIMLILFARLGWRWR